MPSFPHPVVPFIARRDDAAYRRAAGLGVVAGLRSVLPLGLLAAAVNPNGPLAGYAPSRGDSVSARVFGSQAGLVGFGLISAGELVADKLPFIPDRIKPPILGSRLAVGALVGAAVCNLGGRSPLAGAVIGSTAALAGAFAGYYGRTTLSGLTPLPQQVWGVVEDGLAIVLGMKALGARWR